MAKVLMLDQYAGLGGGQRILSDLAGAFRAAGHGVRVMVPGEGATSRLLREEGFSVSHLPLPEMTAGHKTLAEKLSYLAHAKSAAKAIGAALSEEKADLIYANAPRCVLPAVWAGRKAGVRVACGLHLIFRKGLEHRLLKLVLSSARSPASHLLLRCGSPAICPSRRPEGHQGALLGEPARSQGARGTVQGLGRGTGSAVTTWP